MTKPNLKNVETFDKIWKEAHAKGPLFNRKPTCRDSLSAAPIKHITQKVSAEPVTADNTPEPIRRRRKRNADED